MAPTAASDGSLSEPEAPPSPVGDPPDDPLPFEPVPEDHPLYGTEIDGLLRDDRSWMTQQFLASFTEATRRTMAAKFQRFQRFCEQHDLVAFPARRASIYRYIRFLREEGKVGVRSLPQYLAAISMVHQISGHLSFSAFDPVTRILTRAWRRAAPAPVQHHRPVPISVLLRILDVGLTTEDGVLLRAACAAHIDYIFFNRAQSGHFVLVEDVRIDDGLILFRERKSKLRKNAAPQSRYRSWPSRGAPEIVELIRRWTAYRDAAWARTDQPPRHFYRLPGESTPGPKTVAAWFSTLLAQEPTIASEPYTHHGLRGGGASSCFALEVAERRIRDWGGWKSDAMWSYIDIFRLPTEWDFRLFGWMTITARDLHEQYGHIFCTRGASSAP